jgi:hypothetical protein
LNALEVECVAKEKAHRHDEFRVKTGLRYYAPGIP